MNTVKALHEALVELTDRYDNYQGWLAGKEDTIGDDEERTDRIYDLMIDVDNLVTEWRILTE